MNGLFAAAEAATTEAAAAAAEEAAAASTTIDSLLQQLPEWGMKIVGVLAVFIIGKWIAGKLGRWVTATLAKRDFDATLGKFFGDLTRIFLLIVVVMAALSIFGIETTSITAVLAAAGFAVGMALQGSLGNFASGVMLIIFRPFKIGDVIKAAGEVGKVDNIGMFVTSLDTPDNRRIFVGNSAIWSGNIENLTHHDLRRADVPVGCDYSATIPETRKVLESAIALVDSRVKDAPHQVYLVDLGGSSVDWQVRVWCKAEDWFTCREQTVMATKKVLDAAGIGIPFPQMDVHVDGKLGE
ncbi:MAG: mechanosensitive ion channel protein [Proteobacteria bacterium]|nr:MAG: mechanosensitive ion channel protein [Pseudomonadota bacterium]